MSEENQDKKEEKKVEREFPKDIFVIQPPKGEGVSDANRTALSHFWGETWYGAFERWMIIYDVADLVRHIKTQCGDKYYIGILRIGGHGLNDRFRLGEFLIAERPVHNNGTLVTSFKISTFEPLLKEILPYFIDGKSYIVIDACLVGQDDDLLKAVSTAFGGIPVIAPFDYQGPGKHGEKPTLEGKARACYPNRCFTVDNPKELGF